MIVAIDGPAGAGKSTIARRVACRIGATYVDTGAMYRAIALWAMRHQMDLQDSHRLEQLARHADIRFAENGQRVFLNNEEITNDIRQPEIANAASQVAAVRGVRARMVELQRELAQRESVVMEGRDIGSVVFPDAQVKIYLDADTGSRAERRAHQLRASQVEIDLVELRRQIEERDERDRGRAVSPLIQAPDAIYLDSTLLSPEQVEEAILKIIRERTSN